MDLTDSAQIGPPKRGASNLSVISRWLSCKLQSQDLLVAPEGRTFTQRSNAINFGVNSSGRLTLGCLGEFCSLRATTTELLHV